MTRTPVRFLVLLVSMALPLQLAGGDELEGAVRERLTRAAAPVNPGFPPIRGLAQIRQKTDKDRAEFEGAMPDAFAALDVLSGRDAADGRDASDGLIREGALLYRWVTGQLLPEEAGREIPPEPAPPSPPTPEGDGDGEGEPPTEGEETPAKEDEPPPAPSFDTSRMPGFVARTEEGDVDLPPRPTKDMALTDTQVTAIIKGTIQVATEDGPNGPVLRLEGIDELALLAGKRPENERVPLVLPDELSFGVGVDYVAWRRVQLGLRRESLQHARPEGLVSDAEIEGWRSRVARLRASLETARIRRQRIRAAFWVEAETDLLAADDPRRPREVETYDAVDRHWTKEIGRSIRAIEQKRLACEECDAEEKTQNDSELTALHIEERRRQQELRLLFVTILRASAKLDLLDQLVELGREEVLQAEGILQRFEDARNLRRREDQLTHYRYQERELQRALSKLEAQVTYSSEQEQATHADKASFLKQAVALNRSLLDMVDRRQALEKRAAPPPRRATAAPEADSDAEKADQIVDPLAVVRHPHRAWIGDSYIRIVREKLLLPEFNAGLVAEHFEATDDVIVAMDEALQGTDELETRDVAFDARVDALLDASRSLPFDAPSWMTEHELEEMRSAHSATARGVRDLRERMEERLALLKEWRRELLDQGERSFAIRVDRTLTVDHIADAAGDSVDTFDAAADWITLQSNPHAVDFFRAHWLGLAGAVALLAVSVFLVRAGRRGIDRRLLGLAERVPYLSTEPVTVEKERQKREELEQAAETARSQAEEAALNEAAGDAEKLASEVKGGEA